MHIMLIPIGSAGDVYPLLALAAALRSHGHRVEVIANDYFRSAVERAGLAFLQLGTYEDLRAGLENPDLWHRRKGFVVLARAILPLMPRLYQMIESRYVRGETVVVASSLALGARVAQDKLGLPLVTVHLQPTAFRSAGAARSGIFSWLSGVRSRLRDWLIDVLFLDRLFGPKINALRAELGLPKIRRPLYQWWHSPQRVLGLFPDWFAPPQPDWPPQTRLTGFPLYDDGGQVLPPPAQKFLADGPPPIVFTPGSAMCHAHDFFSESIAACESLGRRGVLLTRFRDQVPAQLPRGVQHFDYLPFSQVLPHAAALVSHGGIGTVSQALAAGIPQLLMPMAFDQFSNASRLEELGVARAIQAKDYRASQVALALSELLNSTSVAHNCRTIAQRFRERNPVQEACAAIEELTAP